MSRYLDSRNLPKMQPLRLAPDGYCQWCGKGLPKRCKRFCPGDPKLDGLRLCVMDYGNFWYRIPAFKRFIFIRDNFTCQLCGFRRQSRNNRRTSMPDMTMLAIDHIKPYSQEGPTTLENLQVLCRPCNQKKGVKEQPLLTTGRLFGE